jgi:citrate lyase subunit beta/citryl-CoA lyase
MLAKVFERGADAIDIDLEDSLHDQDRSRARQLAAAAIRTRAGMPFPRVFARVSAPDTEFFADDLGAVITPGIFGVHITKLGEADCLPDVERQIGLLERSAGMPADSVRLIVSIDSAALTLALPHLAATSSRLFCVTVGGQDFAYDIGTDVSEDMIESLWARQYAVLASRAAGIAGPLHPTPFNLADTAGLRRITRTARQLGFQGAVANHPAQIPIIHDEFTPSAAEVAHARQLVETFSELLAAGSGVGRSDGELLDIASLRHAKAIIAAAEPRSGP